MTGIDVVAVDGPAGAGKSVTTRALAQRLGIDYLNTGAMYRAVALRALREKVNLQDEAALARLASACRIESLSGRTFLDGEDVTDAVRAPEVSQSVRYPANAPSVRAILVEQQRRIGLARPVATEGRDQGTVVFPDARCKFYLTASPEERARRRMGELAQRGDAASFDVTGSYERITNSGGTVTRQKVEFAAGATISGTVNDGHPTKISLHITPKASAASGDQINLRTYVTNADGSVKYSLDSETQLYDLRGYHYFVIR